MELKTGREFPPLEARFFLTNNGKAITVSHDQIPAARTVFKISLLL